MSNKICELCKGCDYEKETCQRICGFICENCGEMFEIKQIQAKVRYQLPPVRSDTFFDMFPFITQEKELSKYETVVYTNCPKCGEEHLISWCRNIVEENN